MLWLLEGFLFWQRTHGMGLLVTTSCEGSCLLSIMELLLFIGPFQYIHFQSKEGYPPRVYTCLTSSLILRFDTPPVAVCWSCTWSRLYTCHMRHFTHILARQVRFCCQMVVFWVDEMGWMGIQFGRDPCFGVGWNKWGILQVQLMFLGGRYWIYCSVNWVIIWS